MTLPRNRRSFQMSDTRILFQRRRVPARREGDSGARKGSRDGYASVEENGGWRTEIDEKLAGFLM